MSTAPSAASVAPPAPKRKWISPHQVMYAAVGDIDTESIDGQIAEIWDKYVDTPFYRAMFDLDSLFGEKLSAYLTAGFFAGYNVGTDPRSFIDRWIEEAAQ